MLGASTRLKKMNSNLGWVSLSKSATEGLPTISLKQLYDLDDDLSANNSSIITPLKAIVMISIWGVEDLLFIILGIVCIALIIRSSIIKKRIKGQQEDSHREGSPIGINENSIGIGSKPSPIDVIHTSSKLSQKLNNNSPKETLVFPNTCSIFTLLLLLCLSFSIILTIQCVYLGQEAYNIFLEKNPRENDVIYAFDSAIRAFYSVIFLFLAILSLNYLYVLFRTTSRHRGLKFVFGSLIFISVLAIAVNITAHILKVIYKYFGIQFAGTDSSLVEEIIVLISAGISIVLSMLTVLIAMIFAFCLSQNHSRKFKSRIIVFIFMHHFVWMLYESYRVVSQFNVVLGVQLISWPDLIVQCVLHFLMISYITLITLLIGLFNRKSGEQALIGDEWMALVEDEDDGENLTVFDFHAKSHAIRTANNRFEGVQTHSLSPSRAYLATTDSSTEGNYGAMGYNTSSIGSIPIGMRKATPKTSIGLESSMYSTDPSKVQPTRTSNAGLSSNIPILQEEPIPQNTTYSSSVTSTISSSSWKR